MRATQPLNSRFIIHSWVHLRIPQDQRHFTHTFGAMGNVLSLTQLCTIPCADGWGMCVVPKHGVVVLANYLACRLDVHSLEDGSLLRSFGCLGHGKGQFNWTAGFCGLCVSPDGDNVLVAERTNARVQEVSVIDGTWIRFVGKGVLTRPEYVDANASVIAVAESGCHLISVFSWRDGGTVAQFGGMGGGAGRLYCPRAVRLLADGSGLAVVDSWNHRLCVFSLAGEFVKELGSEEQGLDYPCGVLERATGGDLVLCDATFRGLVTLSRTGDTVAAHIRYNDNDDTLGDITALATLPDSRLVVLENRRMHVFHDLTLRAAWMATCVRVSRMPHDVYVVDTHHKRLWVQRECA